MVRVKLPKPQSRGLVSVHRLHATIGRSRWSHGDAMQPVEDTTPGLPEVIGETDDKGTYVRDRTKGRLRDRLQVERLMATEHP